MKKARTAAAGVGFVRLTTPRPANYLDRIERVAENLERIAPGDYGESHALWCRAQAVELRAIAQGVRNTLAQRRRRDAAARRRYMGELTHPADLATPGEWGTAG